jgi:tetratricopeptide (TPR) repeat protein
VYARLNNWVEAEACFERALEQWRNREDTWNLANTLGELSGLHIARGRWTEARACLDEAWKLVSARSEARYGRLRRELAGRRQELDRLAGPAGCKGKVGPSAGPEPTSVDSATAAGRRLALLR